MPAKKQTQHVLPCEAFKEHVKDNSEKFNSIDQKLHYILNEVSANGNKGLDASLKDIHSEVREIKTLLQPIMDRHQLWISIKRVMDSTWFLRICRTKKGVGIAGLVAFLLINTVLHSLGIVLDIPSILMFFKGIISG